MIGLMLYTTAVSLLLGLAALAVEQACAAPAWPRRWLWLAAMALSLGGPAAATFGARLLSTGSVATPMMLNMEPRRTVRPRTPVVRPEVRRQPPAVESILARLEAIPSWLERPARWTWLGSSLLLLGAYGVGALRLGRARRRWIRQSVGGLSVLIAEDMGPAVFGPLRPVIVLPRWLLARPPAVVDAALTHEREHVRARDPALLAGALLLLALTPWNLPLWWQLRRLRLAIEVDCDRRVLRSGQDLRRYADLLLGINQHTLRAPFAAMAIGRVSQLERRIHAMTLQRPRNVRLWIVGWLAAAVPLVVVAAALEPPATATGTSAPGLLQGPMPAGAGSGHAVLGVTLIDLQPNSPGAAITAPSHAGAVVIRVYPGSAADRAGIRQGDAIVQYGGSVISGQLELAQAVALTTPAERVTVIVLRGGDRLALTVDFSAAHSLPGQQPTVIVDDLDGLRDQSLNIGNPELRAELIRMSGMDEILRRMPKALPGAPPNADSNTVIIGPGVPVPPEVQAANLRRLKAIVRQYGWPTVSLVGVKGARAAAFIAGAAAQDPDFQAQVLALMEPLVPRNEVSTWDYAGLYDQVHTPQRFGTAMACEGGVLKHTKPVEDPAHLNERRAAYGLPKQPQSCRVSPQS